MQSQQNSRNRAYSQGSLVNYLEDKKRKREEATEEEAVDIRKIFEKSRKTARSPIAQKVALPTQEMEEVLAKLNEIQDDTRVLRRDNQEIKKEMEQLREEIRRKERQWEEEKKILVERIDKMEKRMETEERRKRRNNIMITGCSWVARSKQELKEEVENFMKKNITEVRVKECQIIDRERMIIEMESWGEKEKIMKEKKTLKQKAGMAKVFIDNDLTQQERNIQKKLRDIAKQRRMEGKQIRVGYRKIIIDGKKWTWDETTDSIKFQ